jgi:hypothetical protein
MEFVGRMVCRGIDSYQAKADISENPDGARILDI